MKLSDYKDEEALEVLADLLEPATELFSDDEVKSAMQNNRKVVTIAAIAIKNQKKAVIELLAALHRLPVEEYHFNIFSLTKDFIQMLNDPELLGFFASQRQKTDSESFGSVTENTEAEEK